ncbi:hypothetical protein SAMN04487847_0677 [Microbacterium sp. cf332]|nr:hypothetical protein SAMN04487847_0677 [Microbacterium sp. cf332]
MTTGKRRCVFCGAGEPTKEHVLRRKFQDLLKSKPETITFTSNRTTAFGNRELDFRSHRGKPFDWQVRAACGACNNGWMNALENAVEDDLLAMVEGRHRVIPPDRARTLGRWALKTALIRQLMNGTSIADWTTPRFHEIYQDDLSGPVWVAVGSVPDSTKWPQMPSAVYYQRDAFGEFRVLHSTTLMKRLVVHSAMALDRGGPPTRYPELGSLHSEGHHRNMLRSLVPSASSTTWPIEPPLSDWRYAVNITPHLLLASGLVSLSEATFV